MTSDTQRPARIVPTGQEALLALALEAAFRGIDEAANHLYAAEVALVLQREGGATVEMEAAVRRMMPVVRSLFNEIDRLRQAA